MAADLALDVLSIASPGAALSVELAKKAAEYFSRSMETVKEKSETEGQDAARRAALQSEILQAQARAEQEFAIAARLRVAREVEIEEYYDASGKGGLGVSGDANSETLELGAHGAGRKITRRVIRLRGWPDGMIGQSKEDLPQVEQDVKAKG